MKKNKKKNTNKYVPQTGGLLIGETLTLSVKGKNSSFEWLKMWIVAIFGCFGTIASVTSLFELYYNVSAVFLVSVIAFFSSAFLFSMKKHFNSLFLKTAIMIVIIIAFSLILMHLASSNEDILGFKCFINAIVDKAELKSYGIVGFYVARSVEEYECLTAFMSEFAIITIILINFAVISHKSFSLGFVFTFPLIEVGLFFGIAPDYMHFACLLAFWIALVALNNSNYREYTGSAGCDFVRKGNSFMPKFGMKRKVDSSSAICCLLMVLCVFSVISFTVNVFDIDRPDSVNELRYTLKHDLTELSFRDIIDMLSGKNTKTNYGNLDNVGDVEYNDEDMLYVHFSKKLGYNVYLKSYVGSVYDGSSWTEHDDETYERLLEMSIDFYENGVYPQDMLYDYVSQNFNQTQPANVQIDVINAQNDFCYTPYALLTNNDYYYSDDTVILTDSEKVDDDDIKARYTYDFLPVNFELLIKDFCVLNDAGMTDSGSNYSGMKEYNSFADEYYTQVPDDEQLLSLYENEDYADILTMYKKGEANIYETLNAIRALIQEKADYNLSPGTTPGDSDFIYYFLEENHKGYCTHYASAGVILARMAGIPARYAVGYITDSNEFTLLNKSGDGYSFSLKDNAAHAWAEIYIEDLGWVPFEFTEGYSTQSSSQGNTTTTTSITTRAVTTKSTSKSSASANTKVTTSIAKTTTTAPLMRLDTDEDEGLNGKIIKVLLIVVITLAVITLAILVILRSRKVCISKRQKGMKTRVSNTNAVNAYRYLVSLLEYSGLNYGNLTPLEYANFAESKCEFFEKGTLISACNIAMKANFGNDSVSVEEANRLIELSHTFARKSYASKSKYEKFKMKYIDHLI